MSSIREYPSVVDRYYTRKYRTNVKDQKGSDFCVLCHSNNHDIIREKKTPVSVNFQVDKKRNRLDNQASGKGKKGAQMMSEVGVVCHVTCDDGSEYQMYSCIKGKLVEVNERLINNPDLLITKTSTNGYIAMILPNMHEYEKALSPLMSSEEYEKVWTGNIAQNPQVSADCREKCEERLSKSAPVE